MFKFYNKMTLQEFTNFVITLPIFIRNSSFIIGLKGYVLKVRDNKLDKSLRGLKVFLIWSKAKKQK